MGRRGGGRDGASVRGRSRRCDGLSLGEGWSGLWGDLRVEQ